MGISEQIIFPEINYDQIDTIRGMDITISTSARNPDEGRALLRAFNFPFKGLASSNQNTEVKEDNTKETQKNDDGNKDTSNQ